MKTFDIHTSTPHLVEKKKIWYLIPVAILVVSVIIGVIFNFTMSEGTLNLGMDFTGGYSITVRLGNRLDNDDNRKEYEERITDIIENPSEHGIADVGGMRVKRISMQGEGAEQALRVTFVTGEDGYEDYDYVMMMGSTGDENGGIIGEISDVIVEELFADDMYSGLVASGDSVSAAVSSELLIAAICGIVMSLALMLIYIAVRFELSSGVVALLCLVHDVIMMFLFMMVFHVEITSTFVAALITILGYSINNTIIIFDKVRDNVKTMRGASPSYIVNISIRDTMVRSINTTATTFVTVLCVCILAVIFSVSDLITFCLPLMAGLIAGMFSSILLAPSMWAMWKERQLRKAPVVETLPAAAPVAAGDDFLNDSFGSAPVTETNVPSEDANASAETSDATPVENEAPAAEDTAPSDVTEEAAPKEVDAPAQAPVEVAPTAETEQPVDADSAEQVKTDGEGEPSETGNNGK